jgi:hypothetical protein
VAGARPAAGGQASAEAELSSVLTALDELASRLVGVAALGRANRQEELGEECEVAAVALGTASRRLRRALDQH